jgi:hypothetical protein
MDRVLGIFSELATTIMGSQGMADARMRAERL